MATAPDVVLSVDKLQKTFGGNTGVRQFDFSAEKGEFVSLLGPSGCGKTTTLRLIAGYIVPDTGTIEIAGQPVRHLTPAAAHKLGIACIYQQPALFPDLTVAENIFVGAQPLKRFRRIDGRRMRRDAAGFFEQLGVRLDPDRLARGLSIADQQLVEITKALTTNARVIVMDEPTAALTSTEVDRLFAIVEALRPAPPARVG